MTTAEITLVLLGVAAVTDRIMRLLEFLEGNHGRVKKRTRAVR